MQFSPRITNLIHSPIGAAHALLSHRTNDRPLLDLSQAAPRYPPAPVVQARIAAAAGETKTSRYAPQLGLPALREAWAADLSVAYQAPITAADTLITAGCNQAFCVTINALASPGDSVVLASPFYFNHDMWLRAEGIEPRHLGTDQDLLPDPDQAESLIDDRTRAVVLVTPGNPTGITIPPERLAQFAMRCRRHNIALIVDETYRSFRATAAPPHGLFSDPKWNETLISLHSFSKDLAIPGYRVGGIVSSPAHQIEALKVLDCLAISASWIGQEACITGLTEATSWRRQQSVRVAELQGRFEAVMADEPGGFTLLSAGAYFGWVKARDTISTDEIIRRLVVDCDTLVIPGTAFTPTDERLLRFSFANLTPAEITELGTRLAGWTV